MTAKYRQEHFVEMLSWGLDQKIEHALRRIQEFYTAMDGKIYVAFSGGKDSTVLLTLVRWLYPDSMAVFSNTTNEYAEILDFVRSTENVIWVNPKKSFNVTVEEFGFPLATKQTCRAIRDLRYRGATTPNLTTLYMTGYTKEGQYSPRFKLAQKWYPLLTTEFDVTNECCDILKKEPLHEFERESGLRPIIGTQAKESQYRKNSWVNDGCNILCAGTPSSRPLSIWTEDDVWEFIRRFNVPYCTIYDPVLDEQGNVIIEGEKRTGCAYCAFGAHLEKGVNRFQRLSIRKPKQFEKMMDLKNGGVRYEDALNSIGVKTRY